MSNDPKLPNVESCAADGAWDRLDLLESNARSILSKQLQEFEAPFQLLYESGVIVPVLRPQIAKPDLRLPALFLKRVINDLRAVYLLLTTGYTSQAASVAAALYENALLTVCLASSEKNVETFIGSKNGENPWSATDMAKMVVRFEGKKDGTDEFENNWRALYAHYVWLCQCKHPTMQTTLHDAAATKINDSYVIMALPNIKNEDISYKAMVAIHTLMRTSEAIRSFASALGYAKKLPDQYGFAARFQKALDLAWAAFVPFLERPNPVSIKNSKFVKKYPPIK